MLLILYKGLGGQEITPWPQLLELETPENPRLAATAVKPEVRAQHKQESC